MRPQKKLFVALTRCIHTPASPRPRSRRLLHLTTTANLPRKRPFFTSNVYLSQNGTPADPETPPPDTAKAPTVEPPKRKPARSVGAKNSLRRVAIIAQQPGHRQPEATTAADDQNTDPAGASNTISAVCIAESFHMPTVLEVLQSHGFALDPDATGFDSSEVVHARGMADDNDIFVFPSGTIVTWSLPLAAVMRPLLRAAEDPLPPALQEAENLEYATDPSRETSAMRGPDVVVLGTRRESRHDDRRDTTLAKIAFSSGLARSTKLAVLETALTAYFESTRNIPAALAGGHSLPLGRGFILRKTGELLGLRARLNHYSELTDSLPDLFWDSRAELGLEGYYDQVGRALDVGVRIRTLNQKMDYAQEIASVLREMSSERHNTRLEVIIILLIAVEVVFELRRIVLEYRMERELDEVVESVESS